MYVHFKNCEFFVIRYKALIGGLTVLIIYFAADSCELTGGNELCKAKNETCIQVTGFDFECEINYFLRENKVIQSIFTSVEKL